MTFLADLTGGHPSVLIGTFVLGALYVGAVYLSGRRPTRRQAAWFAVALITILFTHGEIDRLADERLFVMHMLEHLIEVLVIPPMLLLGIPDWMLRPWVLNRRIEPIARFLTRPFVAFVLFSFVFAGAHLPVIFDRMCRDENFHIFVHLLFMTTGVLMWWPLLSPLPEMPRMSYPMQILYLFLLAIPMTAVAAPITLAEHVVYPWYLKGPHAWGISPMDDQVLGGLLMWVGQAAYLMCVFTAIFFRWSRSEEGELPAPTEQTPPRPPLRVIHSSR
jgi:putative membrane protein